MDNNFKIKEISERLIKTDISDKRDLSKETFQNQEFSKKEKSSPSSSSIILTKTCGFISKPSEILQNVEN